MTERRDLDQSVQALDQAPRGPAPGQISQFLRQVRELKVRESEAVVRWGSLLLARHASSLSYEEVWLVREQVAIACMDSGYPGLAMQLLESIRKQFPDSKRADRLTGMYNEARGRLDEARDWYNKTCEEEPSNQGALKRHIARVASLGDTAGAITLLTAYLGMYANDVSAWEELGAMYLQALEYRQAAFCYEELLVHEPGQVQYHLTYADVCYTLGGAANLRTARQYYASALQLSGGRNPRALYGAAAASSQLAGLKGKAPEDGLGEAAAQTLLKRYRDEADDKVPWVQQLLKAQGLPTQ